MQSQIKIKAGFVLTLLFFGVAGHSHLMAQSAGTFTTTGNMTVTRVGHSATLLPNGRVLIAGGSSSAFSTGTVRATAELYDPVTRAFLATGNMRSEEHT